MKHKLKRILRRKKPQTPSQAAGVSDSSPRITNDTVAVHREEVISKARKFIYPLPHSKNRIVIISSSIFALAVISFFSYCLISLYHFKSTNTFLYRITQVIPFPIAKAGKDYVAYENYLFNLRRYTHYYETQLKVDFKNGKEKAQLAEYKKKALQQVIDDAYIKQLAQKYNISVTDREINDEISDMRAQNRLGDSDKVFEDVLKDYWGWSISDFKRSLRSQIMAQKLLALLDSDTKSRAQNALAELRSGTDFSATAKKYSEDIYSKDNGGEYGFAIDRTSRAISSAATNALYSLKAGSFSDVVNTGYNLEILKVIEINGEKLRAAHIVFNFKDIGVYLTDQKNTNKPHNYVTL